MYFGAVLIGCAGPKSTNSLLATGVKAASVFVPDCCGGAALYAAICDSISANPIPVFLLTVSISNIWSYPERLASRARTSLESAIMKAGGIIPIEGSFLVLRDGTSRKNSGVFCTYIGFFMIFYYIIRGSFSEKK